MNVGDLIWDADLGQHGVVIETGEGKKYYTILYSDGIVTPDVRRYEVEVINDNS